MSGALAHVVGVAIHCRRRMRNFVLPNAYLQLDRFHMLCALDQMLKRSGAFSNSWPLERGLVQALEDSFGRSSSEFLGCSTVARTG